MRATCFAGTQQISGRTAISALVFAIVGVFVGSGLWVIARAVATERPLVAGPVCAGCAAALPQRAWLPLFGAGSEDRCPACGERAPAERPIFEIAVAAYFAVAAWHLGWSLDLLTALVCAPPLLVVLLVDWWTREIYTGVVAVGVIAGLVCALAHGAGSLLLAIFAAVGGGALFASFFVLARTLYRDVDTPLGWGDVSLAAMIGAIAGFPGVVRALAIGIFLAAVAGTFLLLSRRAGRQDVFAYGPYLCLGALLTLLTPA